MKTIFNINLQLFAADEVVNTTTGYLNANTRENEAYSSENVGLSPENKTYYDKNLIKAAAPNLVHAQFAQDRPLPKGGGKTIEFRKFEPLPKALTPITEGVTPTGNKLRVTAITAEIHQFGDYVELTDMISMTSIDPLVVEALKVLGNQAGLTIDSVIRNVINGGTNVIYSSKKNADGTETEVTLRKNLDLTAGLCVKDIQKAAAHLAAQNAPKFEGSYVGIIHPYAEFQVMRDKEWIDVSKYADAKRIFQGEIGTIAGVRFVRSSEAKIWLDDTCPSGLGVFSTLILGANAYGKIPLAGGGIETIVKPLGYGNDPLNQRSSVGWKAATAAKRLVESYMVRIESCTELSPTITAAN